MAPRTSFTDQLTATSHTTKQLGQKRQKQTSFGTSSPLSLLCIKLGTTSHLSLFLVIQFVLLYTGTCTAQTAVARSGGDSPEIARRLDGLRAAQAIIERFSRPQGEADSADGRSRQGSGVSAGTNDTSGNQSDARGLTVSQFKTFLSSATQRSEKYLDRALGPCPDNESEDKASCSLKDQCPGIPEIFARYAGDGQQLGPDGFRNALPVAINTLTTSSCTSLARTHDKLYHGRADKRPTTFQTWLYGLGFSTLVIIISNIGACLGPCMETQFFKRLLQFLVSMGAGSLASTGLLVLIPEAFDLMAVEELADGYVWKATVAILSIFTFFCSERLLKTFLYSRKKRKDLSMTVSVNSRGLQDDDNHTHLLTEKPAGDHLDKNSNGGGDASHMVQFKVNDSDVGHGHTHSHGETTDKEDRVTLAWMVMAGDVIHNFVDGLSVGAAFTEDVGLGISVSLAILCEELPHELADIAILLHSGLSIKRAVLINFLSACVIFLGLALGIAVGSTIHAANKWIFAMAGGLFLYVPLVDMLPDMSSHLDVLLAAGSKEAKIVAMLHVIGLLVGTAIIVFIVNINEYIVVG
ncbi:Zinc transporter zip14 [Plakobranchus ocellatus]|uniref:Zinc transporter zip14 n=1 Tax=Plakobranchus ocellatus TaxID=259542 RepID=A0AAV4DC23_9GAST|nr:Zinc transporter zip14 [Plakobranchus ocellatus]